MAWEGVLAADAARPDWLRARMGGIGSSEIAYVAGVGKPSRGSPVTVWQAKMGEEVPLGIDDLILELGVAAEPVIAARYSRVTGERLAKGQLVRSSERPWQLATPDFLRVSDDHAVECKFITFHAYEWGDEGTDEIPDDYIAQTQWQMDTLGHDWLHVGAVINAKFRLYTLRRDEDLCAALREEAERFWFDHVLTKKRPPLYGTDADERYLKHALQKYREGMVLTATDEDEALFEAYTAAEEAAKAAEMEFARVEQSLKARIGDAGAEALDGSDWRFSWKKTKDTVGPDWEAIARALHAPDELIRQHTRVLKHGSRRKHVNRKRVAA